MTQLLQRAFGEAGNLPDDEQDALGKWTLAELASDHRWGKLFSSSTEALLAIL